MKSLPLAILAALLSGQALAATVSIYGHIDIGGLPQPPVLIAPTPVIVQHVSVEREPVYLHVPPGHRKHWRKHCREYNACGERVYFVQDDWYERVYVTEYKRRPGPPAHHARPPKPEHRPGPAHPPGPPHGHGGKHDRGPGKDHGHGHH